MYSGLLPHHKKKPHDNNQAVDEMKIMVHVWKQSHVLIEYMSAVLAFLTEHWV